MAMHNVIQFVPHDVQTICMGTTASMSFYVLLGGTKNKRLALPQAKIRIRQPTCSVEEDTITTLHLDSVETLTMRETIIKVYIGRSGK